MNHPTEATSHREAVDPEDEATTLQTHVDPVCGMSVATETEHCHRHEGEDYRFGSEDDFWMGSLVLQWNLFSGLQRKARTDQARAEEERLVAQLDEQIVIMGFKVANVIVVEVILPVAMNPLSVMTVHVFLAFGAAASKACKTELLCNLLDL